MLKWLRGLGACAVLLALSNIVWAQGGPTMANRIDAIPQGYHLHAYDDCGVDGRQPHLRRDEGVYNFTFSTSDNDADLRARTAAFSYKGLAFDYDGLDPKRSYALALTYATDQVYKRVQSLWADGVELHGPIALPKGKAITVFVAVPKSVTEDGKMTLELRIHGEVNATASAIGLWADGPAPADSLRFTSVSAVLSDLRGRVLDLAYDPVAGADVRLTGGRSGTSVMARTDKRGWFTFPKSAYDSSSSPRITASHDGEDGSYAVTSDDLSFTPVRYRPVPVKTAGLERNVKSLDGKWRIHPAPLEDAKTLPLGADGWKDVTIPGQWKQQGYEIPRDQTVAVAREFTVPSEWSGQRIFLRFESIHSGTTYWINGHRLGYSENLFTPVEWEVTPFVTPGKSSRLDLEMKVQTNSERLSYSSDYAFHSLGGIDRSVKLYALPRVCVKDLHVSTDLDSAYRDATLDVKLDLDGSDQRAMSGLTIDATVLDVDGQAVTHSTNGTTEGQVPGTRSAHVRARVSNPLKWSAEKPNLYKLAIEVKHDGELLERIERSVGFRKIEIHGSRLLINGRVVKLAGVCHHEIDPLTGRADTVRHDEQDVRMLKGANLNYIRTSHYPPPQELVDAADRIGMYLEVEAPFCWVGATDDIADLKEILTPTSAMVDYLHSHPSVIVWSIANESYPNPAFEVSRKMVKTLDPTRVTTFNHPCDNEDAELPFDIANRHYSSMPYDDVLRKSDKRPFFLGEYFFPVCHEQTDVRINPGLRELWGHGHADPDSEWGKFCSTSYQEPYLKPGVPAGAWSYIDKSDRTLGGAIFAANDDSFYFADGSHCGYSWHHGYWGLIDAWRRPKPEYWMCRMIFSPIWFPVHHVDYVPGTTSVRLPVENRCSFTDLSEFRIAWSVGGKSGRIKAALPPRSSGEIELPVPKGTQPGARMNLRITNAKGDLINGPEITLGRAQGSTVPQPGAGAPRWTDDGKVVTIEGSGFTLVLDKAKGDFDTSSPRYHAPVTRLPSLHLTRYDFGDLAGDHGKPYATYPDAKTRVVESVGVGEDSRGLRMTIQDRYNDFAGTIDWTIDKNGMGIVSFDYTYTGDDLDTREQGIKFALPRAYDEIRWRRWSEWGDVFPGESISRTEGSARALRPGTTGPDPENVRPNRPWSQDQTELGTADFRSVKFCVYRASLVAPDSSGVQVHANADAHVRACLSPDGVAMHILSKCRMGQTTIRKGDRITGRFTVELLHKQGR